MGGSVVDFGAPAIAGQSAARVQPEAPGGADRRDADTRAVERIDLVPVV
jgi:hypothetical protein